MRWSAELELESTTDIGRALEATYPLGFGELESNGRIVTPTTCREWATLHAQGFTATTTAAWQGDSGAKIRCRSLLWLERAAPSTTSFVAQLRWDDSVLGILPAVIATALSPEQVARVKQATQEGKSLRAFEPTISAHRTEDPTRLELREGNASTVLIHPEAWGDFDGDGFEDVLLSVTNAVNRGSWFDVRLILLGRAGADAMLRVIRSE